MMQPTANANERTDELNDRLRQAATLHRQGRSDEAARLYADILREVPNHPDALHLLGVVYCQRKEFDSALPYLKAAVDLMPEFADAHIHCAKALRKLGSTPAAVALLDGFLARHPDHTEVLAELGLALRAAGMERRALEIFRRVVALAPNLFTAQLALADMLRIQGAKGEALGHYRAAVALKPADPAALNSLATLLKEQGQHDEAIQLLRRAIEGNNGFAVGHNNLGNVLLDAGKVEAAIAEYRTAIDRQANFPEAWNNLGNALKEVGKLDEAVAAYEESLRLRPEYAEAMSNLGNALLDAGRFREAIELHRRALAAKPDFAEAWNNLANVLIATGRHAEALEAFECAVRHDPASHQARFGRGLTRLMLGDFAGGWEDYEHRWWGSHMSRQIKPPRFAYPQWDGTPPRPGQNILVYHEQGFGDTLQFARYLSMLATKFAVTCVCQDELHRLFLASFGSFARIVPAGGSNAVLKEVFDWHVPVMSLPRAFRTGPESIPGGCPYLTPPADALARWRPRIGPGGLRVGVCWSGNPSLKDNRLRSLAAESLAPWGRLDGIRWFGLVKDAATTRPTLPAWDDPMAEAADFADTAAIIACLDLVITVDTSVAHLAGALGKPVWLLSRHASEWRWQAERTDSPWYPSMTIFRQPALEDWASVIRDVAAALGKIAGTGAGTATALAS
ncbi:tetratricopeptide repeat protein [Sulfurisoma sediminicola]|nr:tetratricopeptide repeat protein [Sulfurisoma sediminicola]